MLLDAAHRRALERRMQGPAFRDVSLALGAAVLQHTVQPLVRAAERRRASPEDIAFAVRCHGVAAHLLCAEDAATLPGPLFGALQAEVSSLAKRAEALTRDIRDLGRAAAAAGLAFVPLKGAFLRTERYVSPVLRPSADIDLLADARELDAWRDLLRALGYEEPTRTSRHWIFERPGDGAAGPAADHQDHPRPVELHTRLAEVVMGRSIDITEAFRAGLEDGTVDGVPARVPGSVSLALHVMLHAAPNLLDKGLRLSQLLDLSHLDGSAEVLQALGERLGAVAWSVVALAERDVPGLVPGPLRDGLDRVRPGAFTRRVVLNRPGLLTGDPYRLRTLSGELLLSGSPVRVLGRIGTAWLDRARLEPSWRTSPASSMAAAIRGFFGRRSTR